ncbi:CaiB/BaiF CoA transferase family protein [Streptomyces sp. NPDC090493]|uniref:CaiB/BaiF CoA transferase family protein n=1 Tax=Streptomyces sp. NPDC090493 TaxID=3365964 RepID=UPI0037FCE0BD
MTGPLSGVLVIEVGGIGPGPFAGMLLADMGAEVIRIDRPGGIGPLAPLHSILLRGRKSVVLDLKASDGQRALASLSMHADILIEGYRPGVMERLGLGPDDLMTDNPALIYGRMTGWGQTGPLAHIAGHDINYIAAAGALEPIVGGDDAPVPPLNMLGDFGGGGMLLVAGVLAALHHAKATGAGQVVDAAIVDGAATLTAMHHSMKNSGTWTGARGENLFDGGAPYYRVYRTADGGWLAVGAIEPQFYQRLLSGLQLDTELAPENQNDRAQWPATRMRFAQRIAEKTREEWMAIFDRTDACVTVLASAEDVRRHPHLAARGTFVAAGDGVQPAPAPRFSGTPLKLRAPAENVGGDTAEILSRFGIDIGTA